MNIEGFEKENVTENTYLIIVNTENGDYINTTSDGKHYMKPLKTRSPYHMVVSEESNFDPYFQCTTEAGDESGFAPSIIALISFTCDWISKKKYF